MTEKKKTKKSSDALITSLRKSVVTGDIREGNMDIQRWHSTGVPVLDIAFNGEIGKGFPSGRVIEIYGNESVGKTTLTAGLLAEVQKAHDGIAALYETEATLSTDRMAELGIDVDNVLYGISADTEDIYIEEVLQNIITLVNVCGRKEPSRSGVIVFDTIAGTSSVAEKGKEVGEATSFSPHARALSVAFRKLSVPLSRTALTFVCVNQLKSGAIGSRFATEREEEATLGGSAIKFHSFMRVRMTFKRKAYIPIGSKQNLIGDEISVMLTKHKESVSGTKACEAILVLRKLPPNAGQFSPGLSAFRTLQNWGIKCKGKGKDAKISIKGKDYLPGKFEEAYNADEGFRTVVHTLLSAYRKARMGMDVELELKEEDEE